MCVSEECKFVSARWELGAGVVLTYQVLARKRRGVSGHLGRHSRQEGRAFQPPQPQQTRQLPNPSPLSLSLPRACVEADSILVHLSLFLCITAPVGCALGTPSACAVGLRGLHTKSRSPGIWWHRHVYPVEAIQDMPEKMS